MKSSSLNIVGRQEKIAHQTDDNINPDLCWSHSYTELGQYLNSFVFNRGTT